MSKLANWNNLIKPGSMSLVLSICSNPSDEALIPFKCLKESAAKNIYFLKILHKTQTTIYSRIVMHMIPGFRVSEVITSVLPIGAPISALLNFGFVDSSFFLHESNQDFCSIFLLVARVGLGL